MSLPFEIPPTFREHAARGEQMAAYLDRLPGLVHEVVEAWGLGYDGTPTHGSRALVVPVRTSDGTLAVLKVGFPHEEAEHEHLALQHWHGRGAARLLRADPRRSVLLLERLHPQDLSDLWDLQACEVVGALYGRLHVPAPPQLRTLPSHVGPWTERLVALPRNAPVPRRLVEQAAALGRDLARDPASRGTMIHGDLHYGNVLAADREPWLAIDPTPLSGDPHYEVAPMLWNRWPELAGDVRAGVRRRFSTLVEVAGLDEDRARDWVVVRMLHNAMWRWEDAPGAMRAVPARDWLTLCVTIAKAVQD